MQYPKLIRYDNHRYRGPMESYKVNMLNRSVFENIKELKNIYDMLDSKLNENYNGKVEIDVNEINDMLGGIK